MTSPCEAPPLPTLQWRHNERDGVSNHQPQDCLLNRLFKGQIKENIKAPRHRPLCGEYTGDQWISRTKVSNAENVFIWWRHHEQNPAQWLVPPHLCEPAIVSPLVSSGGCKGTVRHIKSGVEGVMAGRKSPCWRYRVSSDALPSMTWSSIVASTPSLPFEVILNQHMSSPSCSQSWATSCPLVIWNERVSFLDGEGSECFQYQSRSPKLYGSQGGNIPRRQGHYHFADAYMCHQVSRSQPKKFNAKKYQYAMLSLAWFSSKLV